LLQKKIQNFILLWPPCTADADIIFSFRGFFFFFLASYQWSQSGCVPYFYTRCGFSTNLECRSEMCCTQLPGNTGRKNSPSKDHRTTLSGYIFANRKKNLLNINISSIRLHNMANFGSLAAVWGTPANLTGFANSLRYCSDVDHWWPTKLCTMFGCLLGWYIVCTFSWALAPDGILPCKIHFTPKSCGLLYWQRYCMALQRA